MIKISLFFALLLLDDFTGEAAAGGGHRFWVDGEPARPIQKPDGYYIFTQPRAPCTVAVESGWYSPAALRVDPEDLDPAEPTVRLRLLRRGEIRFPGCERLEGLGPPGATVRAFLPEAPPLTLREGKGADLILGGYTAKPLRGLRFAVGEGKNRELFVVEEKRPDGSCRIHPPFQRRHKQGEAVERVSSCLCGPDGRYALCLEQGSGRRVRELSYYNEEVKRWECLSAPGPR